MVSGDFLFTFSVCIVYRWLVPVTNLRVFETISPHNHHNYPDQFDDHHHHPDLREALLKKNGKKGDIVH